MLCIENYKVVIIMRFLLHQSIISKYSWSIFYYDCILTKAVKTDA
jgi:hypothetical protein